MQSVIECKINDKINSSVLNIENESRMHSGSATDSHFKITIVSDDFEGKMLLARHRMINEILKEELDGVIHALTMYTMTTSEYEKKQGVVASSPACQGGGK
jgi:BolA protein